MVSDVYYIPMFSIWLIKKITMRLLHNMVRFNLSDIMKIVGMDSQRKQVIGDSKKQTNKQTNKKNNYKLGEESQ